MLLIVGALYNCGQVPLNCDLSDEACLAELARYEDPEYISDDGVLSATGEEVFGAESLSMPAEEESTGGSQELDASEADNETGGSAPASMMSRTLDLRGVNFAPQTIEDETGGS